MRCVQQATPRMRVIDEPDLLLVDSGLSCDTFNFVSRARIDTDRLASRIARAVSYFTDNERPFAWWVGPLDRPESLGSALIAAGLRAAESELLMAVDLARLQHRQPDPAGLVIERVRNEMQLARYADLLSRLWEPPDENVNTFYRIGAPVLLAPDSPIRLYLGTVDGEPVATAQATLTSGTVGLYNISTVPAMRGRGIGSAMTLRPLLDAQQDGRTLGILQAAEAGVNVYRRLGFDAVGHYTEYQP